MPDVVASLLDGEGWKLKSGRALKERRSGRVFARLLLTLPAIESSPVALCIASDSGCIGNMNGGFGGGRLNEEDLGVSGSTLP